MAAQDAVDAQPASLDEPVATNRFVAVMRACGREAAGVVQKRTDGPLIESNQKKQKQGKKTANPGG